MANTDGVNNRSLYAQRRYRGSHTPEYLTFNTNLQEFSQKISYISALETRGKLSPEQAFQQVKCLWKQLKQSKKTLGIGAELPPPN